MFRFLGEKPGIDAYANKLAFRKGKEALFALHNDGTVGGVIDHLLATERPALPDRVRKSEEDLPALGEAAVPEEASGLEQHKEVRDVAHSEIIALVCFIEKQTPFATQHSVKGPEFVNVLVVLGGGWNHYNCPQLLELIATKAITRANAKSYYRARNFSLCRSRGR